MGLIDFTKNYILRKGDLKEAKIGHVNYALEQLENLKPYKEVIVTLNTTQLTTQLTAGIDLISNLVIDGSYYYPYGLKFKMIKDTAVVTGNNISFRNGTEVVAGINRNCLGSNPVYNNIEGYFDFPELPATNGVNLYDRSYINKFNMIGANFSGAGNITIELTIRLKKWK